jgi:hypothetical protein
MRRQLSVLTMIGGLLGGCGGDPGAIPDSGVSPDAGTPAPLPPLLTPCPTGWREVADAHGQVTCDPFPETGYRTDCAFDEAHFPGTPTCARIGTACATDGWPSDLPLDRPIVYVDDDATPGGDGSSHATAFASIGAATAAAPADAIIAVASGRYDEPVSITGSRTLWGACVDGTRLVASTPSPTLSVLALAGSGSARNLSIDTPERVGLLLEGTASALDDVVITAARRMAIYARSGTTTARNLVVRDTRGDVDGTFGHGIEVRPGAHVVLESALLERNREHALSVAGAGATLDARDLAVMNTLPDQNYGGYGYGIALAEGSHAALDRVIIGASREAGLFVADVGTTAEAHDLVVRDTESQQADGTAGDGIVVQSGGALVLSRALLERNRYHGMIVGGSTVDASDVVIRDTRAETATLEGGRGIAAQSSAHVALARALLDRNQQAGLSAHLGAIVEAHDVVIRDTQPQESNAGYGVGAWAQEDSRITLTDARIEGAGLVGIASLLSAVVTLDRVVVSGVTESACAATTCAGRGGGFGLLAQYGGTLTASHFSVEDSFVCGVVVGQDSGRTGAPSAMDLLDGTIDRTPVGACVQASAFDYARLQPGVEYRDVGVPLRATSYSLPDAL